MTGEAAYPANLMALYTELTGFLNDGEAWTAMVLSVVHELAAPVPKSRKRMK